MLQFDEATTRLLETAYVGRDFALRRRTSLDALLVRPGDYVVDIGCGTGLMSVELARSVGQGGKVVGVDPSQDMLAGARDRTSDNGAILLKEGTARALPVADSWADAAVSLQVFEYVDDVPAALRECHRVLKPGGRLVIGDMLFDTLSWFSDDADRMTRMITSWNQHVAEKNLPAKLPRLMSDAGFIVERVTPLTFCDHVLRPDGLANMMCVLMKTYAVSNAHFTEDDAAAWADEQNALAQSGRFFFSLTHIVVTARKA